MFILFSPSETKTSGGGNVFNNTKNNLIGGWECRNALVHAYEQQLVDPKLQQKLTGIKDDSKISALPTQLDQAPVLPAIERYTGVGYQYLDYPSLQKKAQQFIHKQVIIFSNLLGPLRASDLIPETKLKQTKKLAGIDIAKYYKQYTSKELDKIIGTQPVLDLRAGAYKNVYSPKTQTIECNFLKDGKTVSHWSKAYRGLLLRACAQHQPKTLNELTSLKIDGLELIKEEDNVLTYQII